VLDFAIEQPEQTRATPNSLARKKENDIAHETGEYVDEGHEIGEYDAHSDYRGICHDSAGATIWEVASETLGQRVIGFEGRKSSRREGVGTWSGPNVLTTLHNT
jgi:hypothetical protein